MESIAIQRSPETYFSTPLQFFYFLKYPSNLNNYVLLSLDINIVDLPRLKMFTTLATVYLFKYLLFSFNT